MKIDREAILKKLVKIEDRLLVSKILDKAVRSEKSNFPLYSDFLDPHQRNLVEKVLEGGSDLEYEFNGGYIGAERVIIIFRPGFMSDDYDYDFEYPFRVLSLWHALYRLF